MKIIKLHVLSLLFVGSFNVLGTECKIKNKDLIYEVTSSIYSYSNVTKTGNCRCKTGYEFMINPALSIRRLSASGKDNLFTESPGLEKGKKLQCVIAKYDTELSTDDDGIQISTAAWVIPISLLSIAVGTISYNAIKSYYDISNDISRNTHNSTDTIEMLDRHLLPENQLQSVERNIYSKLDTSRVAPSNENTPADFGRNTNDNFNISENTNDNFNISEHTFVDSNVIEGTDVNSNLIENTGASNETIYTSIDGDGDSVHTPLNGGATGGPGDLPSTTADAGIRAAPPVPERGYREISSNVRGKCNIL